MSRLYLFFIFVLFPHSVSAQGASLIMWKIPGVLEPGGNGTYTRVVREIEKGWAGSVSYEFANVRRAFRRFREGGPLCVFVAGGHLDYDTFDEAGRPVKALVSDAVQRVHLHVYSLAQVAPPKRVEDLAQKVVGVGFPEALYIDKLVADQPGMTRATFSRLSEALEKLVRGRVNLVAAYDYDMAFLRRLYPAHDFAHDPSFYLEAIDDVFACKPTQLGRSFLAHINARLADLRETGQLERLIDPRP